MASSHLNISRGTLFGALLLGGMLLLLTPQRYGGKFSMTFRGVFNRVLSIGRAGDPKKVVEFSPTDQFVPKKEYVRLKIAHDNTYAKLLAMQRRCTKLQMIRSGLPKPAPAFLLATVSNSFISALERELIIAPTTRTNVLKVGQYVVGRDTLIGTISEVGVNTTRVRLVSDAKHYIPVVIRRDGKDGCVSGQMQGNGDGTGKIPNLSQKEYDIHRGDTVLAAAVKGRLEAEIVIGEVSHVIEDEDYPLLWDITVKPFCQPETLYEVAVLVTDINPADIKD